MTENRQKLVTGLLGLILLGLTSAILIMAAVPPVSRDALTHHLAVPKLWVAQGGIHETPDIAFSYYPMNLDLLYALPLIFGNDILPKFIHMAFGLGTALMIYAYLATKLKRIYALTGVLLFLSLPVVVKLSITAYVDLGLVFFSTGALLLLIAWRRSGFRTRYLLWSAICCGLAMGTKYNALPVFVLLALLVPYTAIQAGRDASGAEDAAPSGSRAIGDAAIFVFVALLVFAPWAIRNYLWTGNPLHPLYQGLFNSQAPGVETNLHPFVLRKLIFGESLLETFLIPIRIFFQGQDDMPALFDGRLNPYLFFLPLVGMLPGKNGMQTLQFEKKLLGIFALLVILIVFFTRDMRIRYVAPAIPPLIALSVYGLHNLFDRIGRIKGVAVRRSLQSAVGFLMLVAIGVNGVYIVKLFVQVRPLDYLSGRLSRDVYIQTFRPEYAAVQYVNDAVASGERTLCLFLGNRRYYFDVETVFLDARALHTFITGAASPAKLTDALQQQSISHVIIGWHRLQEWSKNALEETDQFKLSAFLTDEFDMLFAKDGYAVFKIR